VAAVQHHGRLVLYRSAPQSLDGHVFIERLWRSLKHEDIYLKGYADGREAYAGIASWLPSTTLGARTRRSATARR
jgi:hypothetical protein